MINIIIATACGGAIGAVLRLLISQFINSLFGGVMPIGTLFVNVVGSFLMGVIFVIFANKIGEFNLLNDVSRSFLMTGLLGGFTTFSAFSLEFLHLIERNAIFEAFAYLAISVIISIAALFFAVYLTRSFS